MRETRLSGSVDGMQGERREPKEPDRDDAERGATLVEYALLVALVALVAVSSMTALQSRASEKYQETSAGITTEVAGVVIEPPSDDTPDDPEDDEEGAPAVSSSCGSPNSATCLFSLTDLPESATVTWELDGLATGDEGPTYSFAGKKNTSYTVTAVVSTGESITRTITCDDSKVCTAS